MTRRRSPLHIALLASATLGAAWLTIDPSIALGQHTGGTGTVTIENEAERQLFWSLICSCGCPRETLGTCPCDFGSARREEMRGLLKGGMSVEQIQDAYVARYGSKFLAVPRNEGSKRLLWMVPTVAILIGAGVVVVTLRRWKRRSDELEGAKKGRKGNAPAEEGKRDQYDDQLDQELRDDE
ncbi:cytochrome c-type biogenesis protein [Polyangium aurulentum]|uniref:cytochrome c-type biogenesis protein n=1 Tax=Polyangium aurulentum TaxID=2567896 RepID=UPI0010ADDBC9|nr:cytochrome c-type biogenesis protein CcmH [Polyangium aurulentum]UQA61464.1 cytochrome c-type biogenesis protein CcmH [Polyangium aurulentum]